LQNENVNANNFNQFLGKEITCNLFGKKATFSENNNKSAGIDEIIAEIYYHSFDITAAFTL
jgi:hypothetical protein